MFRPRIATALISALVALLAAAADARAASLYWTQADSIVRTDLNGGNRSTVVSGLTEATFQSQDGIALDAANNHLYWADNALHTIREANLDGTNQRTAYTGSANMRFGVAVGGGSLYWVDSTAGAIYRAALDGSSAAPIVTSLANPFDVQVDAANGFIYVANYGGGSIVRAHLDGTSATTLISGLAGPNTIGLDVAGGRLYWLAYDTPSIQSAKLDGTGLTTVWSNTGDTNPQHLALDLVARTVTWAGGLANTLKRASMDGTGSITTLLNTTSDPQLSNPRGLALLADPVSTPEPASLALLGLGLAGAALGRRRR